MQLQRHRNCLDESSAAIGARFPSDKVRFRIPAIVEANGNNIMPSHRTKTGLEILRKYWDPPMQSIQIMNECKKNNKLFSAMTQYYRLMQLRGIDELIADKYRINMAIRANAKGETVDASYEGAYWTDRIQNLLELITPSPTTSHSWQYNLTRMKRVRSSHFNGYECAWWRILWLSQSHRLRLARTELLLSSLK